jgi:CSLREA domain-containing protein
MGAKPSLTYKGVSKMANTGHTKQQAKYTKTMILAVLTLLLALSFPLLAASQQADASIFYTVSSTGDAPDANPGDGYCEVVLNDPTPECTLRAAIQESNANPASPEIIFFHIPGSSVQTIRPNTELPDITDSVTIDGYSQPGSSVNTLKKGTNAKLKIELDGAKAGPTTSALHINAPNVVVKGLVINRFYHGLVLQTKSVNSKVEGNFIGTDPSGTLDRGLTGTGVVVDHSLPHVPMNITIGGSPTARNLISGNGGWGIFLGQNDTVVYGNLIGTERDGRSPLGNNSDGVSVTGNHNVVGGSGPGYANIIAFNGSDGVLVQQDDLGNIISSNSIFSNKGLGIDLGFDGSTPNDIKDPDTGANNLQNKPVLSSAKKSAPAKTTIKGKLNSTPNQNYTIQLFKNPKGTNEGMKLLFSKTVSTDGSGNLYFTFSTKKSLKVGQNITATATNNSTWDASEFSAPRKVVQL